MGGYFFLRIMETTRVMIETIKIPNVNKSFTVMYSIGNAPFRGQNFNRLPFKVAFKGVLSTDTILHNNCLFVNYHNLTNR